MGNPYTTEGCAWKYTNSIRLRTFARARNTHIVRISTFGITVIADVIIVKDVHECVGSYGTGKY